MSEKICLATLKNLLTPKEMKNVLGGSGEHSGSCGWSGGLCCISKEAALYFVNTDGGNWCCDSCSSTSYCGGIPCE